MTKKRSGLHLVKAELVKDSRTVQRMPSSMRMDGWKNLVTLLGTKSDSRTHSKMLWEVHDPEFFEQLYSGGGVAARIVDLVPDEACRRWIDWQDLEEEEEKAVEARCKQLDLRGSFNRAWKWGRAYGGGCLHIVTDTRDPSSPLKLGEKVIGLRDLSRWDLRVLTTDIEYDFGSPNFGHPRIYYLNLQMGSQYKGYPIHWTRMIRFDGQLVPRRTYIRNNYWHDSVLNRIYDAIRDYGLANDAAGACLMSFNVDVMKMKNLAQLVGAGKESVVQKRMQLIQFAKSVLNMVLLDADKEEYENVGRSLEGVPELWRVQANRLVAETDIPHTKLLGESPDGSNATGNSTSQQWYNFIQGEQTNYADPKLTRLLEIIFPDLKPAYRWRTLRVLDDTEEADLHLKQAQADQIYLDAQVVDPTEIAKSRFGGKEYSIETELDQEARDAGAFGLSGPELAQQQAENAPDDLETDPKSTTGEEPSEPEPGPPDEGEGGKNDLTGRPKKAKKDAESAEGQAEGTYQASTTFKPRNEELPRARNAIAPTKAFISQMMSLPMRDPKTNPRLKGPGIPNAPRTVMPTQGNGVTAQSGAPAGVPVDDMPLETEGQGLERSAEMTRGDRGVEATMKEFAKGTLKSSSGKTVTDPKQAAAIGYSEERGDEAKRAAKIIVRDGDKFLMGKRRDNGRWTFPGGHVNDGESHHQGAVRELAEETGLTANRLKFLGARMVEPEQGKSVHVNLYQHHLAEDAKPTFKKDPDKEFDEFRWMSAKEKLPAEIAGNLHHPNDVAIDHLGVMR